MSDDTSLPVAAVQECPRCGYDQRGVIATWTEQCPLDGTCTECGLRFSWTEVFTDTFKPPCWCVESAQRWFHFPWRALKTLAMSYWPWGFWNSLKMTHKIRWRRIAAYLMMSIAAIYFSFAAVQACVAWRDLSMWLQLQPVTATAPATTSITHAEAALQAFVLPVSSRSPGAITRPLTTPYPLPSPRELASSYGTASLMFAAPAFLSLMIICGAAAFAALPQSRRIAKVRWAHIFRVMLYGLALPIPVILLLAAATFLAEWGLHLYFINFANA